MYQEYDKAIPQQVQDGAQRRILSYSGSLMMVEVEAKAGTVLTAHSHPHQQISYIAAGSFDVRDGEERYRVKAGDSIYFTPGVTHGMTALEDSRIVDVFTPIREDFLK